MIRSFRNRDAAALFQGYATRRFRSIARVAQRKLAQLAADTYAADAMTGALSSSVDRADSDYALEAACAKVFASERRRKNCDVP